MGRFSHLSVEALQAEVADYEAAIKAVALGGGVGVVVGEGRRMEITRPDVGRAETALRDLRAELARRPGYEHLRDIGGIALEVG